MHHCILVDTSHVDDLDDRATLVDRMAECARASILESRGGTISPRTARRIVADIWAASLQGYEERHAELTHYALEEYIRKHSSLLFGQKVLYLGLWLDDETGEVCLDITKLFLDDTAALAFAAANDQKAVTNLLTLETKWLTRAGQKVA